MKIKFLILLLFVSAVSMAQELTCVVRINAQQIQTSERLVFDQMQKSMEDFMNDRVWTDDRFENQEKIKCVIQVTLESSPDIGRYSGSVQVVAARPVYNTTYESTIVNFPDREFEFNYIEGQQLIYNEGGFADNLTSMLAYYGNMVLAYDYDSFSLNGGEEFYKRAWDIVTAAQNQGFGGWDQFGNIRNRYWWVNDAQNQVMESFREAFYDYHRKGLDLMQEDQDKARLNILESLKKIAEANRAKPRSVLVIVFTETKQDELINIFSEGEIAVRREAFDVLKQLDPARTSDYQKIITN